MSMPRRTSRACRRATSTPPSSSYAGKRSTTTGLLDTRARAELEPLAEAAHAPLANELETGRVGERQRGCEVASDQVGLAKAGELEDAAPDGEHPGLAVADDEAGGGGGVVVLEQLEEKAEAAAAALGRIPREAVVAVDVDRALAAVGADEDRHLPIVGGACVAGRLTAARGGS